MGKRMTSEIRVASPSGASGHQAEGLSVERLRTILQDSHISFLIAAPNSPIVMRAAAASMNSQVAFRTSVARNSSASRLVRNPRLSVCDRSGFDIALGIAYR